MKRLKTAAWWTLCVTSAVISAAMAILIIGAIAAANGTAAGVSCDTDSGGAGYRFRKPVSVVRQESQRDSMVGKVVTHGTGVNGMRKLSEQFIENRNGNVEELERERDDLFRAVETYNAFVEEHGEEYNRLVMDIKDAVNSLNIALAEANGNYRKAAAAAKRFMKRQKEGWLESQEGRKYSEWANGLDSVSYGKKVTDQGIETILKLDIPNVPDPRSDVRLPGDEPTTKTN